MNFIENSTEGRPALALIAINARWIADPDRPGAGLNTKVHAGHVRAVRLIPEQDASGEHLVRRELLAIVCRSQKNWRIARGTA